MKKLAYLVPVLAVLALALTPAVFAQAPGSTVGGVTDPTTLGTTGPVTNTTSLVSTILGLVNWVAWFVALVAVLFGLYSGILFITAGGDEAKVTKAKNILLYAIVGIVVAILAFSIVSISRSIVGF